MICCVQWLVLLSDSQTGTYETGPWGKALESTVVQDELEALTRDHEGPVLSN